jgi:hypothetical protein
MGKVFANVFADAMRLMAASSEHIPKGSIVASVKHENCAILAGMQAVNLVGIVPLQQKQCNLKINDVDVIFSSQFDHGIQF